MTPQFHIAVADQGLVKDLERQLAEAKEEIARLREAGSLSLFARLQGKLAAIEDALDEANAPSINGARWLTLPERVAALAALKPDTEEKPTEPASQSAEPPFLFVCADGVLRTNNADRLKELWAILPEPPIGAKTLPLYTAPPSPSAEGWQWVPKEPTEAMYAAWMCDAGNWSERYAKLLAAAPNPKGEGSET